MKCKETVNDEAIKNTSKAQRALGEIDTLEMEDPEGFKLQEKIKSATNKKGKEKKKAAREDREKTGQIQKLIAKQKKDKAP